MDNVGPELDLADGLAAQIGREAISMLPHAPLVNNSFFTIHTNKGVQQLSMNSALGIFLSFGQTFFGALGKDLFRLAFVTGNRWFHVVGTICAMILDPILNISALNFATYAIVSACSSFAVFWNILLAPCILGERLTRMRLIACVCIMLGTVWVGIFGPNRRASYTGEQWLGLLGQGHAVVYFILLGGWCVFAFTRWRRNTSVESTWGAVLAGTLGGNTFPIEGALAIIGCDATHSCSHGSPWMEWQLYILLFLTVMTAGGSLFVLALTLKHAEALDAVTVFTGIQICFSAMSANIVLNEAQTLSTVQFVFYAIGLFIILCGLGLLCFREGIGPFKWKDETLQWPSDMIDACRTRVLEVWYDVQFWKTAEARAEAVVKATKAAQAAAAASVAASAAASAAKAADELQSKTGKDAGFVTLETGTKAGEDTPLMPGP